MSDSLNRLKDIFLKAMDLSSPAERAAYLDEACTGDIDLRQRVEEMLAAADASGSFLEKPAAVFERHHRCSHVFHTEPCNQRRARPADRAVQAARAHRRGGHGRRLRGPADGAGSPHCRAQDHQAGHGLGPGPRPLRGRAAGPGPDGPPQHRQGARRRLDRRPAVPTSSWSWSRARPSPSSATSDGSRHVSGSQLFVPVCQAIQHAHQKGVIHRDIKPSNVLVALYDDRPVPKVIDFGVAKATGLALTEQTLHNQLRRDRRHARVHEPGAGRASTSSTSTRAATSTPSACCSTSC